MSDPDKKPASFARTTVEWGRLPPLVFQAGPLPKKPATATEQAGSQTPLKSSQDLRRPVVSGREGGSILSGSLVPKRRAVTVTPEASGAEVDALNIPPIPAQATPAPSVRPASQEPVVAPVAPLEPAPLMAIEPVSSSSSELGLGSSEPFAASLVEARSSKTPAKRVPVLAYVGVGVVLLVVTVAILLMTRPQTPAAPLPQTGPEGGTLAVPSARPEVPSREVENTQPVASTVSAPLVAPAQPPPVARPEAQPAPISGPTPGPEASGESPYIQITPTAAPVVEAQPNITPARPAPSDPDAPIVTKPQELQDPS